MRKILSYILIVYLAACTTVMQGEAEKPDMNLATIESDEDSYVTRLDGHPFSGSRHWSFQIASGEHSLAVDVEVFGGSYATGVPTITRSNEPVTIFLNAEAGHVYLVRAIIDGERWMPEIVDKATGLRVGYRK